MDYKKMTIENKDEMRLPNEPCDVFGRLIVSRINNPWSYEIEEFDEVETMVFPDENYDFHQIQEKGFAIGAYHEGTWIGLAIYEYNSNSYLSLYDSNLN